MVGNTANQRCQEERAHNDGGLFFVMCSGSVSRGCLSPFCFCFIVCPLGRVESGYETVLLVYCIIRDAAILSGGYCIENFALRCGAIPVAIKLF